MKNIFSASWRFIKKHVTLMRILVISFLFIMIFVDENSFVQSFLYDQQIHGLKKEIQHYQGVIEESKTKLNELQSNEKNLEKFAREQYLMKKDNEDIYIITEEEQKFYDIIENSIKKDLEKEALSKGFDSIEAWRNHNAMCTEGVMLLLH